MSDLSAFEFRAIEKEERPAFDNIIKYVFANNATDDDPDEDEFLLNEFTTAAFYKGKMVATSGGYPFELRFNGQTIAADGLTAVGTQPGFRRRGLVREMVTRRLQAVHEDEHQSVSILWASMGAIYQRFGYGLASTHTSCDFDPRNAAFQFDTNVDGHVRIIQEDEGTSMVKDVYQQFIQPRTMDMQRSDLMWKYFFKFKKEIRHCAVYFNATNQPEGYLSYTTSTYTRPLEDGPYQKINVREFVYLNIDAYRALWNFIREHDLVRKVKCDMPLDDPAMHLLLEPRNLNLSVWDGVWLRIVDAAKALTQRNYGTAGSVVLEVTDDNECPWNQGRLLLDTDGTNTEVAESNKSADVVISPNGLASLLSGNAKMSELDRMGRANVAKSADLDQLDFMFTTKYRPFCRDDF